MATFGLPSSSWEEVFLEMLQEELRLGGISARVGRVLHGFWRGRGGVWVCPGGVRGGLGVVLGVWGKRVGVLGLSWERFGVSWGVFSFPLQVMPAWSHQVTPRPLTDFGARSRGSPISQAVAGPSFHKLGAPSQADKERCQLSVAVEPVKGVTGTRGSRDDRFSKRI